MRPQQTTPTSLPSQVFYPYTSKKSGKTYEVPWNKPDPPSQDDFDFLEKQILADEDKEDKPVKIETKIEEPTLFSRTKDFAKGVGEFGANLFKSQMLHDPLAAAEVGQGAAEPFISAYSDEEKAKYGDDFTGKLKRGARLGTKLLGADPNAIEEDWQKGRYGALAGDILPPVGLGILMHKVGGLETKSIPKTDLPFDTVVRTVPDAEPPRLNAAPPPIPPTPKQLPGIGESTPTRLPGTPPTAFNRYPDVPTPPRFASHPSGAVGDLTNISTPEGLSSLNIIRPPEGTTPPVVGNPFKKNALPPIEELPIVDTSIIEQRKPPIQPQPNIIPQVEPPTVQQPSIVPQPIRPPEMGMVPTPPRVEPPLQQSPIVSKFKPDIGPVSEGEPKPVGSGSTIPRKQGLFNRLFGDATGTFDPEAMGKEIERLKQQFLEKQASKKQPEREPIFHDVPAKPKFELGDLVRHQEHGVGRIAPESGQLQRMNVQELDNYRDKVVRQPHPTDVGGDRTTLQQIDNEFLRRRILGIDPDSIKPGLGLVPKRNLPDVDTSVAPEVKEISGVGPADYEPQEMRRKPNQAERVGLRNIRVDALKRDIDAAYRANDINKVVDLSQQLEEINRPPLGEGKVEQLKHTDRSDVGYEALPEVDTPQEMKVAGVKEGKGGLENIAMGGANERTLDVMGTALYSRERPVTVVKELLQNAFDEHKEHGIKEPVRVLFNGVHEIPGSKEEGRSLTVRDRGKGLSPEEMYTVLTNIGETGKAGVESASGGFGFAKAAPFMGGKYVRVRSVVDTPQGRKLYTFEGSPEQLKKQTKGVALNVLKPGEGTNSIEQMGTKAPTGMEITVWYDKKMQGYYNARLWAKNMTERSPSAEGGILYAEHAGNEDSVSKQNRRWLDESKDNPIDKAKAGDFLSPDYNYPKDVETEHRAKPMPTLQDKFEIPGAKVNIHYDTVPGTEASSAELHFANKGMYQGSKPINYGDLTANVPTDIVADIIATVEEGANDYPFSANREQIQVAVTQAIDDWVSKNIVSGIMKKRVAEIQRKYDAINRFGVSGLDYLDDGERLAPDEIRTISGHPKMVKALSTLENVHRQLMYIVDSMGWTPQSYSATWKLPSERLKKFGLLIQAPDKSGLVLGIHIPRPDDLNNSAILINLFEHLNDVIKKPNPIDQLSTALLTTLSHEYAHIPGGGHDQSFAYRDADLHSKLGQTDTVSLLNQLAEAFNDGRGNISSEIQRLLQIYNTSRTRAGSGDDAVLKGGINIKRPPDTKGPKSIDAESLIPSEAKSEPIEPVDWTKAGEVPVNPDDYGQVPKVIKLGKGLSKLKPESSNKLEYEDLPSAPVKPKIESTLKPGELNTSRFGGGKEPPKEPPNKLVPEPEPPEKPRNIPPERVDPVYQDREFLQGKSDIKGESQEAAIRARKEREADIQKQKEKRADKYAKEEEERNKPKTVEDIIADKKKKNPGIDDATFTKAVKALPERFRNNALYKAVYEPLGVSGLTKLKRMGESGIKLAKMIRDERTESNRLGGEMAQATREARRNLSKLEQTEVVKILDGQKPYSQASSQAVKDAYKALRATTEKLGNEAIKAGVRMKDSSGDIIPFEKLDGEYFPHRYPEELFKDDKALRDKLLKAGNSPAAVDAMMDRVTKKGERFSSAQHARDFDLPGYHETLDALEAHQYEMARVITRAKRFGPGDVSDANSPISKLIAKSDSPTKAQEIVNRYLNRKESNTETEAQQKIANIIVNAEVGTKLSQFMVSNVVGDLNTSTMTLGIKNTANALTKTLTDPHGSADIATRSGALSAIRNELTNDVTAHKLLGKAYGTMTSEKLVRTVEALAGRAEVNRLFELAKKDKKHVNALSEFVDGDVNSVLKQDKLTDEQLDFASGRAAEMTSGIPDATTLSKTLNAKNPLIRLLTLFKRFSFLNVKNLSDAVGRVPESNLGYKKAAKIAAILVGYQVAGETIGDIKALIKGLASGDIKGDIEKRGDYVGFKNKTLDRVMANYLQSALFGLVGDAAESIASRPYRSKFSGTALGPVGSDLDEMLDVGSDLMTPSKPGVLGGKPAGKSRFNSLGKAIVKRVPYIGAGLQERWDKEKEQGLKGLPAIK